MRSTTMPPRWLLRAFHLASALPLALYFYGPLAGAPALGTMLRMAVLPFVAISGVVLWQRARLLRWRARRGGRSTSRAMT